MANLKSTTIDTDGFLNLPVGSSQNRPAGENGLLFYNTDLSAVEWYDSVYSSWFLYNHVPVVASGGQQNDISVDGYTYRTHTFTSIGSDDFIVTREGEVDFLLVAGGGAGSDTGSGGGGGVLQGRTTIKTGIHKVQVGYGGANVPDNSTEPGGNGGNSSFAGFTAFGGGGGGSGFASPYIASRGGSGGGGGSNNPSDTQGFGDRGVPGQGHRGGDGNTGGDWEAGGGGGGGLPGFNAFSTTKAGDGGTGISSLITGSVEFFAGGGGGATGNVDNGRGGLGGGGSGEASQLGNASMEDGVPNTGGGGGGEWGGQRTGSGGSGIVIIRYRIQ